MNLLISNITKRALIFLLFSMFIFLSLFSCEEEELVSRDDVIIVPSLESKLLKVYSYDREHRVSVVIIGERNTIFKSSKEIWLDNIRALYISYDDVEPAYTELTADNGKVNYDTLDSETWGNTVIKRENEMRIETNKVFWDNSRELFYTKGEEEVVIYKLDHPKDTIVKVLGINLIADKQLEEVELDSSLSISPEL